MEVAPLKVVFFQELDNSKKQVSNTIVYFSSVPEKIRSWLWIPEFEGKIMGIKKTLPVPRPLEAPAAILKTRL